MPVKSLRNLAVGLTASTTVAISAPSAQAQVAVDSLLIGSNVGIGFSSSDFLAPTFTTGPSMVQIDEIVLSFFSGQNSVPFNLDLYTFIGGIPVGPALASANLSAVGMSNLAQDFIFNKIDLGAVGSYNLLANTAYAFVLSSDSLSILLEDNNVPSNAYTFGEGFSAAGVGYYGSPDGGTSWSPYNYTPVLRISVSSPVNPPAVPGPIPVFGAAAAFGFSRKLRKRIARNKALPVASAID